MYGDESHGQPIQAYQYGTDGFILVGLAVGVTVGVALGEWLCDNFIKPRESDSEDEDYSEPMEH